MELNQRQIGNMIEVLDLDEDMAIESASIESENGGNVTIHFVDLRTNRHGVRTIYLAKHSKEDRLKAKRIIG